MKHKIKRTLPCAVEKWEKEQLGEREKLITIVHSATCNASWQTNAVLPACLWKYVFIWTFFSGSCFIEFLQCQCPRMPSKNSRYLWFFYSHSISMFCSHKLLSLILGFFSCYPQVKNCQPSFFRTRFVIVKNLHVKCKRRPAHQINDCSYCAHLIRFFSIIYDDIIVYST